MREFVSLTGLTRDSGRDDLSFGLRLVDGPRRRHTPGAHARGHGGGGPVRARVRRPRRVPSGRDSIRVHARRHAGRRASRRAAPIRPGTIDALSRMWRARPSGRDREQLVRDRDRSSTASATVIRGHPKCGTPRRCRRSRRMAVDPAIADMRRLINRRDRAYGAAAKASVAASRAPGRGWVWSRSSPHRSPPP